jgi:hypothetical protein
MTQIAIPQFLVILFVGLIIYGIPIVVGIWVIAALTRVRSSVEALQSKVEAIEQLLRSKNQ